MQTPSELAHEPSRQSRNDFRPSTARLRSASALLMQHGEHVLWGSAELATATALITVSWAPTRWPIVTGVVLLCTAAVLITRALIHHRSITNPTGLEAPLLLLLLTTLVAVTPVTDWEIGLPKLLGVAAGVLLVIVIGKSVTTRRAVVHALDVTMALGGAAIVAGLLGTTWPTNKLTQLEPLYQRIQGVVHGFVPGIQPGGINPAEVAGMLILVVPILFTQVLVQDEVGFEHRPRRVVAGVLGAIGLMVVALTQSRSAILGVGVALAILGAAAVRRLSRGTRLSRVITSGYAVGLVVVGVASVIAVLHLINSPGAQETGNLSTFAVRRELWDRVLMMIQDFPITGIGIGQFSPVFHTLYPSFLTGLANTEYEPHGHNLVLEFAVELGVPGAVAFLLLVCAFFRQCARAIWTDTSSLQRWTGAGVGLGMLAFLIYGFTDAIAPGARGGIAMWWVFALGGAVGTINPTARQAQSQSRVPRGREK